VRFAGRDFRVAQSQATDVPRGESRTTTTTPETHDPVVAPAAEGDTEVATDRYPDGKIKIQRHVAQDAQRNYVNHGPWTLFDLEGNAIATGTYKLGKRDGIWSRLQPKTSKHFEGPTFKGFKQPFVWEAHFADDVLHGRWTMLDAEARLIRTWEFEQGRLHGKAIDWHPNGKKRRELTYNQGVPHGELREWDDNGKLVMYGTYQDGRAHRAFVERYPTGEKKLEGWYLGAKEMVRVAFNWWDGTIRIDLAEAEGKEVRHGQWTAWHANGGKQYEGQYEHDRAVGLHTWWFESGQKRITGHFVGGKETGRWTWWHESGFKNLEGQYLDGKKDGRWSAWHANGQKHQTGSYTNDKKTGEWTSWDASGKLIESRDLSVEKPQPKLPQPVAKPAIGDDNSAGGDTNAEAEGPLSRRSKQVPELLRRWLDRHGATQKR
jgi:antitoxin component YwqK of YwqJK toxin-antitoxin module